MLSSYESEQGRVTGFHSWQIGGKPLEWLSYFLLAALGCSGSASGPPAASVAGVWELQSVNGGPLPFLRQTAQYSQQIVGEDIILRTNNTFASFTIERFFTGATSPAAAPDTVYNLGYWNTTSGDLVIGAASAEQRGDTLTIRSSDRGLSTYVRR